MEGGKEGGREGLTSSRSIHSRWPRSLALIKRRKGGREGGREGGRKGGRGLPRAGRYILGVLVLWL